MSIVKWLTGKLVGGDAVTTARLDAELTELYHALAPLVQAGTKFSFAITSAEAREGRTRVALYLAEILADNLTGNVLLVDADGRRPRLHEEYDVANTAGLAEVLAREVTLAEAVQPTVRDNQFLLPVGQGPLTVGSIVSRQSLQSLLAEARDTYRAVVFDTGPLLEAQESLVICHSVHAVLLVVLAGATQGEIVARAHRMLQRSQAPLLGVVVNDPRGEFQRHES